MSHSSSFKIPGYEGDVVVIHNGDWSGDATVVFKEAVHGSWDKEEKVEKRIEVPGRLLVALGLATAKQFVMTQIIRTLEQVDVNSP